MKWQELLTDIFERNSQAVGRTLDGLNQEELNRLPKPDCNSIGWLVWHLTRGQDGAIADLAGEEQLWIKEQWHAKYDRSANAADTGFGNSPEDVAAFKSPDAKTAMDYHQAVVARTKKYVGQLSESDLGRELKNPVFPTVGVRLVGCISDNLQHAGQAAYVRGLLQGKGWLPF